MPTRDPVTETIMISKIKSQLSSLVNDVYRQERRIVVEKSRIPVAAIIPIADLRRLIWLDDRDREAREIVEAMRVPFDDVPPEQIERQTERILAEIREEDRAARKRLTAKSA